MSASAEIHAQLASILERFAKRALLEMSRAVEQEMTRRQMEVETLLLKLQFTESELRSARQNQPNLRSVGTQANSSSGGAQREVKLNFVKINENHDGESQTETHTDVSSALTFTPNEDGIKSIQIKEEHMEDGQWDSGLNQDSFSTGTTGPAGVGCDFILTSKMKPGGMWISPVSEEYPVNSGAQSLEASPLETGVTAYSPEAQADHHSQEKVVVKNLSEEKPQCSHAADVKREESVTPLKQREEEELSGLEFEMKIEQVEELVDQTLNLVQAEQKRDAQNNCHDGNSQLWCSGKAFDHPEGLVESEVRSKDFIDSFVMMEDPMVESTRPGLLADLENEGFEYCMNPLDSLRRSPRTSASDSTPFNTLPSSYSNLSLPRMLTQNLNTGKHTGEKPFRCQLCGKGFSQRTRLLTHRLVHTGEKPFRCEECGKGFTQRKRLLTHRLVHTGEKPFCCQLCGKTFSRQDNCLRHVRLHSGQR